MTTITYKGKSLELDVAMDTVFECTGDKANVVSIIVTNLDSYYQRSIPYFVKVVGPDRDQFLYFDIDLPYGCSDVLPGITLENGESIEACASVANKLHLTASVGEIS